MRRKRKVMVVVLLVLTLVVGISYSSFVVSTESIEASRLLISNMMYKIDIKSTGGSEVINGRKVSLTSGNTSITEVTITSLNKVSSKYDLEYKIVNGKGKVYYASDTGWKPTGVISSENGYTYEKKIKVVIESEESIEVELNVSGGYIHEGSVPGYEGYTSITEEYKNNKNYISEVPIEKVIESPYGGEANNNYLQYPTNTDVSKNIWRIIGSTGEGVKVISEIKTSDIRSNISSSLNSFYNTLENREEYINKTNKFNCSSTGCDISSYQDIGLISTYEYNTIGGINSYLASTNNFFSINSEVVENITPNGIENTTDSTTSGIRPVVYLNEEVNVTGSGTISDPYRIYSVGKVMTVRYTIDNVITESIPSQNDYIVRSVECTNGAEGIWENESVRLTKEVLPTTCTVDFTRGYNVALSGSNYTYDIQNKTVGRIGSTTFTINPNTNYTLTTSDISCTNNAVPTYSGSTLTISNIKSNTTCSIVPKSKRYAVTVTSNDETMGTVSVSPNPVEHGGSVTITLKPVSGYKYLRNTCGAESVNNVITLSNVTAEKTCTVTFIEDKKTLYATLTDGEYYNNVLTRSSFDIVLGDATATTRTIYKTTKASENETGVEGEATYYFAGNVGDNWVYFAESYWRIIRTNSDNSVRLLYAGTSPDTESGYITTMKYNNSRDNVDYVNWSSSNLNNVNITNSVAHWYTNLSTTYKNLISTEAIYCNDMSGSTREYGAFTRVQAKTPSFKCTNNSFTDGYGLMTADEVAFSGGVYGISSPYAYYYLNSAGGSVTGDEYWWTMSPARSYSQGAAPTIFIGYGSFFDYSSAAMPGNFMPVLVTSVRAVRPVVSLKSSVLVSGGNGTSSNPYTVE